jgi:ClpP class serine protease
MTIWLAKKDWLRNEYGSHRLRVIKGEYDLLQAHETGLFDKLKSDRPDILSITGDKAVITINGPTTENGPDIWDLLFGYGGVAYTEIIDALNEADAKLSENGIIEIRVNTPGGEVSGVEATYEAIAEIASRRTVNTIAESLMASAGIWYTAPSTSIISGGRATLIGSVGVAVRVVDWSEYYESAGVRIHDLTNVQSPDKRPDVSTEEGRGVYIQELNDIYEVFISSVVEGRGKATSRDKIEALKGAVVTGEKALEVGFVDKVGENELHGNKQPAQNAAGKPKGKVMTLQEFLAENPVAAKEIEDLKAKARQEGSEAAREEMKKTVAAVKPIMVSDAYPAKFTEFGMTVLTGERTLQSYQDLVAMWDLDKEAEKSAAAKEKEKTAGDTPPTDPAKADADKKQGEVDARVDRIKNLRP